MDDIPIAKPLVSTQIDGQIGTIILDNPEKRNALSHALIEAVISALEAIRGGRRSRGHPACAVWREGLVLGPRRV